MLIKVFYLKTLNIPNQGMIFLCITQKPVLIGRSGKMAGKATAKWAGIMYTSFYKESTCRWPGNLRTL